MKYEIEEVNIASIKSGDTIEHEGVLRTVCRCDIRDGGFSPWAGLAGPVDFDGTGQNTRTDVGLATVRNGVLYPLSRHSNAVSDPTRQ